MTRCCGATMKLQFDAGNFMEFKCSDCGEIIYVKNPFAEKAAFAL
jgi:transcription initiation factor IIE alpha subunit